MFLLHHAILLLFIFISCPFTEILDAGRTVRAVMPPKEIGWPVPVVFAVALPCDKAGRGFFTFAHDELGTADADAGGDVVFLIDCFAHYIAAVF